MGQNVPPIIVLSISINNIEKHLYVSDATFYFETMEAHLTEGMKAPKLVTSRHSFQAFECAFIQMCRFYPVFNYHLIYIHEDYKNQLKVLIEKQNKSTNCLKDKSRSWLFFML
jgi:hypothetical protein